MEYINRKSLIYKSGLGFYCINHVQGCYHGCRYPCYAYMMAQSHGRINALKALHDNGCQTYVHIEPYPTPNFIDQNLEDLLKAVKFVDNIYFSGWNYNSQIKKFPYYREFYSDQANLVQCFCREHGIQYS